MVISENAQLGLRFKSNELKLKLAHILHDYHQGKIDENLKEIRTLKEKIENHDPEVDGDLEDFQVPIKKVSEHKELDMLEKITLIDLMDDKMETSYFLICESVYKAAELIKIGPGFTSRTVKDIKFGKYTYLMGKNRMVRFIAKPGYIYGIYFDDKQNLGFQWVLDIETGDYIFPDNYIKEFSEMMKVLTFVELGDIEVNILPARKTLSGANKDKVVNSTNNTVFVVDSTWNQIIIRTEGFAVRGHFKLQPCGPGLQDRKLIWIDAFEKHGYKRKPKAEIRNL